MNRSLILAAAVACLSIPMAARAAEAPTVYGLLDGSRLIAFSAADPSQVSADRTVTGLAPGATLVGIDRRPADATIYGVGRHADGTAELYTIEPAVGTATLVAALTSAPTASDPGGTPIQLSGARFGFDFNPVADALRIISDTGQNLRVIPSARSIGGTVVPAGGTFADGALNRDGHTATGVTAAAYINNDTDPATGTALYDLDTTSDELVLQNPPNTGSLIRVSDLGRETASVAGFDVLSTGSDPTIAGDTAYAALTQEQGRPITRLVLVELSSGEVHNLGALGAHRSPLTGIAL